MAATPTYNTNIQHTVAQSSTNLRLGLLVLMTIGAAALAIVYLVTAVEWSRKPFPGVLVNHTLTVAAAEPNTGDEWPGLNAGLMAGDRIISVNDQPVSSTQEYYDLINNFNAGDSIIIGFERPDLANLDAASSAACTPVCEVTVSLTDLPEGDFIALFVTPFVSGLVVLAVSVVLLRLYPRRVTTFLVVVTALFLATMMVGIYDAGTSHRLIPVWLVSAIMTGAMAITIGILYPSTLPVVSRNPNLQYLPFLGGLALSALAIAIYSGETPETANAAAQIAGTAMIMGVAIMAAIMFFYQRPFAITALARQNANIIFFGVALALAPGILWLVNQILQLVFDAMPFSVPIEVTMPFLTVPIFSLFFATTQTRRIDSDRMVTQSMTYAVMLLALIIGYFLLVLGGSLFTTGTLEADNPLFIVLTVFFISVLFIPIRTGLQNRIDRIYFRKRTDYQNRLEEFTQKITSLAETDAIITVFRNLLNSTVEPAKTLVFLQNHHTGDYVAHGHPQPETDITFGPDSGVVELLQNRDTMVYLQPGSPWPLQLVIDRARLEILHVKVIAGLPGRDALNGFVCLSAPKSGAPGYNFEELRFINNLATQLAVAVERAQAIASLERRVNELNVLSQVGQAVNFTIEVNDLLELISVQTLRLIDSPFFYIALRESATDQLYFAFFLENDIRDQSKESKKWPIGNDLFSEVVISSQPRRVDDYAETMRKHNYRFGFENPNINAWMGVPLISGTSTLGVVAIGESDPNKKYSVEQMRIFSDIGALAATSIEKANLFTNAHVRARQLSALNDISRELVETEGDLDKLLELITQSAVDILGSEAGSLLLTQDDGRLQFTASVGGTSDQLIGTTLEAGHGLVGQVAKTGEPIISNDTSVDERWQGEVLASGFSTDSILAVPLVTKGRVVGVLEVINKQDGTIYVEDDVELLSAFASQAAIAYENARLRQQTGVQLEKRVRELEALERIDRELNQTLALGHVADITLRWAIRNSNATAGVLGTVEDDSSGVLIVAKSGYDRYDKPEGAEDDIWPIDKGIVARVIRTRRPDLQPDVSIDPEYIPSLNNALSQITVPMLSGDEINAILVLETDQEPRLNLLDLDWVQRLAEHASIAIANAQLYEELTRANETKSEFVAFAAHELNNPLTSVMGWASTMRSSMVESMQPDQIQNIANVIHTNADRMQNIIKDLRDIAASDANKLQISPEAISLSKIVTDTLMPFQKQIDEKDQTIINKVSDDLPQIMADPKRLIQVMTNFISNAHKYSPEGSTITIDAGLESRYVSQNGRVLGRMMRVSISDTGIGMSEADLKRIFKEDYFRSEHEEAKQQKGTGLGMMITKRIIEGHGGEVWVESEFGSGSTFSFVIPLAATSSQELRPQTREPEAASD